MTIWAESKARVLLHFDRDRLDLLDLLNLLDLLDNLVQSHFFETVFSKGKNLKLGILFSLSVFQVCLVVYGHHILNQQSLLSTQFSVCKFPLFFLFFSASCWPAA